MISFRLNEKFVICFIALCVSALIGALAVSSILKVSEPPVPVAPVACEVSAGMEGSTVSDAVTPDPQQTEPAIPVRYEVHAQPPPGCGHAAEIEELRGVRERLESENRELRDLLSLVIRDPLALRLPLEERYEAEELVRGKQPSKPLWVFLQTLRSSAEYEGKADQLALLTYEQFERLRTIVEETEGPIQAAWARRNNVSQPMEADAAYDEMVRLKNNRRVQIAGILPPALADVIP